MQFTNIKKLITLKTGMFLGLLLMVFVSCTTPTEIKVQSMNMNLPEDSAMFKEELLNGEIADTKIEHLIFAGPTSQTISFSKENVNLLLFIKGNGRILADTTYYAVEPETLAIPNAFNQINLEVPEGETLHLVQFTKKLSPQDLEDLNTYPAENKYDIYFTKFIDCIAYTEKIKSPNTVSRTVLPGDIIPRVALGTVETKGPDEVGAHEHAMLDQLFLGLTDNDVIVHADDSSTAFKAFDLLHIPIGSSHWVTVEEGKKMYYLWMDFFLTKEGQEWLKTHKPTSTKKSAY
jgi:hypothetical protein